MVELITAMTTNRCIGVDNDLPWKKMKSDMSHFRGMTIGKAIIMGRRTFESLGSKALPKRLNIVVSGVLDDTSVDESITVVASISEAIEVANKHELVPIFIGGAKIYEQVVDLVDVMYITMVNTEIEGDTFFPEFNYREWEDKITGHGESNELNEFDYTMHRLEKL